MEQQKDTELEFTNIPDVTTILTDLLDSRANDLQKLTIKNCYGFKKYGFVDFGRFPHLESLTCEHTDIEVLDVSRNKHLKTLHGSYNENLHQLLVNRELEYLYCFCLKTYNATEPLKVYDKLKLLDCNSTNISFLDLTEATNLEVLDCSYGTLNSLNVSRNGKLKSLQCSRNPIKTLDFSQLTELEELDCSYALLETLDVSGNPKLKRLSCGKNSIRELNLSGLTELEDLDCRRLLLESLDVSRNRKLEKLNCYGNRLMSLLDISYLGNLKHVNIADCNNGNCLALKLKTANNFKLKAIEVAAKW